ncbi:hypothetical protein JOC74_003750 [Bacillus capparidis]|uniref:Uncharacterized protein n=1 Tax=Bacillus capparidis TaxID=1840411 RepID=A0ABS4D0T0_9BACI|nr:hypothetical protein [Bacillus capparidis]
MKFNKASAVLLTIMCALVIPLEPLEQENGTS